MSLASPSPESRITAFLQRAAPIIARERGLNSKARLLLDSLAKDMALSAEELQQAISIIQQGQLPSTRSDQALRESFRQFLKVQFQASSTKILSAKQEQVLLAIGIQEIGLQEEAAREEVRTLAHEAGLKRISREEAERYVASAIAQKLSDAEQIEPATILRLQALGADWGLEPAAVQEMVELQLAEQQSQSQRAATWYRGAIGGALATVALVVVVIVFMSIRGSTPVNGIANPAHPEQSTPETNVTPATRSKPPSWWTAEIAVAASNAKQEVSNFAPVYEAITASAPERRTQGYELLLERASKRPFDTQQWKSIGNLVQGCLVHEPEDSAAQALLKHTSHLIQQVLEHAPAVPSDYEAALRPFDTLVQVLQDKALPAARGQLVREELEHFAKHAFTAGDAAHWNRGRSYLAAALLEKMSTELPQRPVLLTGHYAYLATVVREHAPEELAERQALLVAAAIESTPGTYSQWKMLANQAVEVRNPLALIRIVDAWEATSAAELKDDLAPRLLARVGLLSTNIPREEIPSRIRDALGIARGASTPEASPWSDWEKQVAPLFAASRKVSADPTERLRDTVDLAWRVNQTMLLVRDPSATSKFLATVKAGSPVEQAKAEKPAEEAAPAKPLNRPLDADQMITLQRYTAGLEDATLDVGRRVSYLRGLAKLSEQVPDVPAAAAQALAKYVFAPKSAEEHEQVLEAVVRLRRWKQLRLAVADELATTTLSEELLTPLVLRLTGREPGTGEASLAAMRLGLLQNVLQELTNSEGVTAREDALQQFDQHAQQLTEVYRERARLWGVPPSELTSSRASDLLRQATQRLRLLSSTELAIDPAARLPELAALLGNSELQRTILQQRECITRSVEFAAKQGTEKLLAARKLEAEYLQRSTTASDALTQLRDGEHTLLAIWMLFKL